MSRIRPLVVFIGIIKKTEFMYDMSHVIPPPLLFVSFHYPFTTHRSTGDQWVVIVSIVVKKAGSFSKYLYNVNQLRIFKFNGDSFTVVPMQGLFSLGRCLNNDYIMSSCLYQLTIGRENFITPNTSPLERQISIS